MKQQWRMANLTACPFCHSQAQALVATATRLWAVVCEECGAMGPTCFYKGEAVERWEAMSMPPRPPESVASGNCDA